MATQRRRLGIRDVDPESLLTFPAGLVGMPSRTRFALLDIGGGRPLAWMQCVDDPDVGVPVALPEIFVQDYQVELPRQDLVELDLARIEDAVMLVVTTVHAGGELVTGNLRAPLLVNAATRMGKQVVLDRPELGIRTPVDPVAFARAPRSPGPLLVPEPARA